MASSLGTAFGVAVSAAIFTALAAVNVFSPIPFLANGQPDPLRFAAAAALWFNVALVVLAALAIRIGMPKQVGAAGAVAPTES
ncbi:hypothetical protein [Caballeronia ptereochthonis]|uniref:EmrB/QacA family drug resistance transporter n=1 Tax=Caballeronia ptereochthonis TaxID=1777144 RepID=A0A158C5S9_9BURK|nr:hypothetical protein [Caballeronia ptereochthonis]SAK77698.1 hypothetical protein AWB83_04014 [Caballeronia ptereochthonis]